MISREIERERDGLKKWNLHFKCRLGGGFVVCFTTLLGWNHPIWLIFCIPFGDDPDKTGTIQRRFSMVNRPKDDTHKIEKCINLTLIFSWWLQNHQQYHLESRWRNSHVLVYHGPLLFATFWEWLAIYFHDGVVKNKKNMPLSLRILGQRSESSENRGRSCDQNPSPFEVAP